MSIYEKIATTNQGSTYQVPNPLNTGEKADTDWMSIVIIAQIVLLIVVAAAIYIFEVPIESPNTSTFHAHRVCPCNANHQKQSERVVMIKQCVFELFGM